jgi:hypothetical protein
VNRATTLCIVVAALLGVGCSKSDASSLVVVTVTAPPTMPAVTQLRAVVTNAGSSDTKLFPQDQSTTAIPFDTSFAVTFPKSRGGELDIAVDALTSASQVVTTGSNSVVIVAGGRADVTIHLALVGGTDAGVPDADAANDDRSASDTKNADGPSPADVLPSGFDARDLAGIPSTGGTGGTGGSFPSGGGSGGASGIGSGGAIGSGGTTSTGGMVATGGLTGSGGGDEPCSPAKTITGGKTSDFGTKDAFCFKTPDNITGWGCANFTGRTLKVNGVTETCGALPLPAKINGYYYFDASAGSVDYSSIYWY